MKKIFLTFLIALLAFISKAQSPNFIQRTNGTFTPVDPFLSVPKALYIPRTCDTINALNGGKDTVGAIIWDTCNRKFWIRDGVGSARRWSAIGGAGSSVDWCNVALAGADAKGTTDASSYVQALINSGCKTVYLPKGTYWFNNTVQMKDSVMIIGDGKATVIKLTKNIPAFKCGWALGGNKTTFQDISFLGTYPQDSTSQDGIFSDSCNGILTTNISAMKLAGWAIHFKNNGFCCGGYPLPTAVLGNLTSNCFIDSSYGGVFHDIRGEFNSVVNSAVVRGKYGIYTSAGSSRIADCNLSGTDYGMVITGGSNNAHGTMIGTHIAHCRRMGLYVTGATNGFEIIGSNIRQDSILIENSDNIRFSMCELGANGLTSVVNSTNTIFQFNRIWGPPAMSFTGSTTVTGLSSDSAVNGISLIDFINSKRFDISHVNGLVDFTGRGGIRRIRMLNDTLNFSNNGAQHYFAGGEISGDSVIITSTTSAIKGKIKFGTATTGMTFNEATGSLGLGTTNPTQKIHIRGSGILNIGYNITGNSDHARITMNNDADATTGFQILYGGNSSAFVPGFAVVSSLKDIGLTSENGNIRFTKSTSLNGSNEHARFTNTGLFGIGTTSPTSQLDVNAINGYAQLRLRTSYTPASSADANGNVGDFSWDDNYLYIKTSAGWKRSALSTF